MRAFIALSMLVSFASTNGSIVQGQELPGRHTEPSIRRRLFDNAPPDVNEKRSLIPRSIVTQRNPASGSPGGSASGTFSTSVSSSPRSNSPVAAEPQMPRSPGPGPRKATDAIPAAGIDPGYRARLLPAHLLPFLPPRAPAQPPHVHAAAPAPAPPQPDLGPLFFSAGIAVSAVALSVHNALHAHTDAEQIATRAQQFARVAEQAQNAQRTLRLRASGEFRGAKADQVLHYQLKEQRQSMEALRVIGPWLEKVEAVRGQRGVPEALVEKVRRELRRAFREDGKLGKLCRELHEWDGRMVGWPRPDKEVHSWAEGGEQDARQGAATGHK